MQLYPMYYNNPAKKIKVVWAPASTTRRDTKAQQAYKEVTEKPTKKQKVAKNSPGTKVLPETSKPLI